MPNKKSFVFTEHSKRVASNRLQPPGGQRETGATLASMAEAQATRNSQPHSTPPTTHEKPLTVFYCWNLNNKKPQFDLGEQEFDIQTSKS